MSGRGSAREEVLGRVRAALAGADPAPVHVPRSYRDRDAGVGGVVDLFVERVEDYRATVTRCGATDVVDVVGSLVPRGARVLLPPGLPWPVPGAVDAPFSAAELDRFDAVVTAATVAVAGTGTIVLTHGPAEGRRALSLVPDLHVCVVRAEQVVADVPQAVRLLEPLVAQGFPQTWISGPSATSDIELDRVEGVHGPRTLHVVLVG